MISLLCCAFAVSAVAAEPRQLTYDGVAKQDVVFVPGGAALVFATYETSIQISLMQLRLADGTVQRLHPNANTAEFEAGYSPDGRYYAFVQSRGNLSLKLVIRDTKEGQDAIFDPGGGFAGMHNPAFAPDLSRIVFSQPGKGGQQLVSCNLQGQDRRELTQFPGLTNWPSFSPDGQQLLFGSSRDGDFEIYLMRADGTQLRRLTESPGRDIRPRFSPDGSQIAFTSVRDGNPEIYVMQADGSHPRRITQSPERDDAPCWHPDGQHLLHVSERNGKFDIYETRLNP
jgi:Tol biopolymer transport system component